MRKAWRDGRSRAQIFVKHKGALLSDAFICFFHTASLLAALTLLLNNLYKLAIIAMIPSLVHRLYRAIINIRSGDNVLASILNSLTAYILHISFVISFPYFYIRKWRTNR